MGAGRLDGEVDLLAIPHGVPVGVEHLDRERVGKTGAGQGALGVATDEVDVGRWRVVHARRAGRPGIA